MTKKQMPDQELRERLARAVARIAEMRDEDLAAAAHPSPSQELFQARAGAFVLALAALHAWTRGEFGQAYDDQPNPYAPRDEQSGEDQ